MLFHPHGECPQNREPTLEREAREEAEAENAWVEAHLKERARDEEEQGRMAVDLATHNRLKLKRCERKPKTARKPSAR